MRNLIPIRLAQALPFQAVTFHVTVHDKRGNPFPGARVSVLPDGGASYEGETDSHGIATFQGLPRGGVSATVELPNDLRISRKGDTDGDLMIEVPICAPVPLVTTAEGVAMGAGAILAVIGWTTKSEAPEILGELLVGGGIFSVIYRNSCSW